MKKITVIFLLLSLSVICCGCIKITVKSADGGIFQSTDGGETWAQKVSAGKVNGAETNISNVSVETMAINPQNTQNIFIGTSANGMYATDDGGESWKSVLSKQGYVGNIAVDSQNGDIVYTAIGNQALKSTDSGRNWTQIYLETMPKQTVTALAVDSNNTKVIYLGISDGRVLKSVNAGQSWEVAMTPKRRDKISQIIVNPANTQAIYVAAASTGLYKSIDGGQTWADLSAGLKPFSGANYFRCGAMLPNRSDSLVIAAKYGLLKTEDGGTTWQAVKLLTSPGTMDIYSLAVNPRNEDEVYYGTAAAIYQTTDGGKNWIARSLPTKRTASFLLIDPSAPRTVYLGTKK